MITATYVLGGIGMLVDGYLIAHTGASVGVFVGVICAHLLLRLCRSLLRLSDRERDLPAGDEGDGDRALLRDRDGIGGAIGPLYYGKVVDGGNPDAVFVAFAITAALMCIAAAVEWMFGVPAEQKHLEEIAEPLSAESVEST